MTAAVPYPIGLPSGAGDCLWAVGKLKHVGPLHYLVADGQPFRTKPWFDLLGPEVVASVDYGHFTYTDIVTFENIQEIRSGTTWGDLARQEWGQLLLEPNQHLEAGKPLADWLPDLPVDYHVPMYPLDEDKQRAPQMMERAVFELFLRTQLQERGHDVMAMLAQRVPIPDDLAAAAQEIVTDRLPRPFTMVSCASYRGSQAWNTWDRETWLRFLARYKAEVGGTIFLMGGFWDDLTAAVGEDGGYPCLVGKTSMGCAVEMLKHCDRYIGFSSGLGMLNAAMWGNTFLLWPDHQVSLSRAWADPRMLEAETYSTGLWRDPDDVWPLVKRWLRVAPHAERREFQR